MEDPMSFVRGGLLSMVMATGFLTCAAQSPIIPFKSIEHEAQLSARVDMPSKEALIGNSAGESTSAMPSESSAVYVPPAYKQPRTLSKTFFLINGLHLGLASLDIAMTQHCIADGHCREGNPMMPSSLSGQV